MILLDLMMPDVDGFETCKAIRKLPGGRYTQILMVTGLDDNESIERAFDAGANDFVTKPINWTMLSHKGKYLLRAGRAFKELDHSRSRLAKTQGLARLGNWQIDLSTTEFSYQFYKASLNLAVIERFYIERDLKKALSHDELVLFYQPQIDLSSRRIVGAEALIRWNHPMKGMITPDRFIPIAEESGQIIDVNRWVIQTACGLKEKWLAAGLNPVNIAVNLSGYRLSIQKIVRTIKGAVASFKDDNLNLEIEITENVLMQDDKETISTLQKLKDLKLRIALDDFGTGYSSLSYLTSFPVDTTKIDRSFVMGCTTDPKNLIIIKAIIAMGHSMGKRIVAEGIETEVQFEMMKELGCDEGQGYLFKHPVPAEDFAALLANEVL